MKKFLILLVLSTCSCSQIHASHQTQDTAELAVEVGALDKALELTRAQVQKNVHDVTARFHLADIYHKLMRYDMESDELTALEKEIDSSQKDYPRLQMALMRNALQRNEFDTVIQKYADFIHSSALRSDTEKGKSMMYAAVAHCKKNELDICLDMLDKAKSFLPGDDALAQNISLASWMKKARSGKALRGDDNLYQAYHDVSSPQMFSNLVLSLISEGDNGHAYELLLSRYSAQQANNILDDLKNIKVIQ
ncbi:hypothetical protein HQN64_23860 [Enterobacteriaceae bacterium BIT-l23]|uniref:hypothetical protein n=1 Tax=Jejubacter sp. L23 TaxID=3092086 RepID=UPI001585B2A1|nr:hypothetical protein [Enterobacteriaceae bacterium BIT-l23]